MRSNQRLHASTTRDAAPVVRGSARLTGPDPKLMDRLAAKYTGLDRHPLALRDSPDCIVVRVSIDRISGVGPWVETAATAS